MVQAERVRLLSPMRGSLLQVNTSGSTSSVQVKNNSGLVIGDEVGALKTLTLSLVRQNGLGIQGFLAIIALQTLMLSLLLQNGFGMQTGGADNIRS